MTLRRAFFVLLACLWCSAALAGPQEDAYQAIETWAAAFNAHDLDKIVAAYAPNALVLGTLSPGLASNADDLRAYFRRTVAAKSQVKLGENAAVVLSPEADLRRLLRILPAGEGRRAAGGQSGALQRRGRQAEWRVEDRAASLVATPEAGAEILRRATSHSPD